MRLLENVPDIDDPIALADWIEILIFTNGRSLSKAQLRDYLTAAGDTSAIQAEEAISFVCNEIKRRRRCIGNSYPFAVDRNIISFDSDANSAFYKYLLVISVSKPFREERRQNDVNITFDEVTRKAAEIYLGEGAKSLRFGWPPSGDRPSDFPEAVGWLCAQLGLTRGSGHRLPTTNDGGLDVVVWKPFPDGTRPFLVLLLQSTVQIDWLPKIKDITQSVWQGWLDTGKEAMIGVAIPFVVSRSFVKRDELSRTIHLLLDRVRLAYLLRDTESNIYPDMITWTQEEMERIITE